ncbi:WD40 repeat domain-containing protein [Streptomyces virginiae]
MTEIEEFTSALSRLRQAAGEPSYKVLVSYAARQNISVTTSSLSDWFTGKSVPAKNSVLRCVVTCLADRAKMAPAQRMDWVSRMEKLRAAAWKERHPVPGVSTRPTSAPEPSALQIASGSTIGRHAGPVNCVVCTDQAGGLLAVSGGHDDAVRIWNVEGQRQEAALMGHERAVNAVLVCRIGSRPAVVSAGQDCAVRLWDLQDQRLIGDLKTFGNGSITAMAAHPQEAQLLVLERGLDTNMRIYNRVRVWDLATQKLDHALTYWRPGDAYDLAVGVLGDTPGSVPVAVTGVAKGATVRVLKRWNNYQGRLEPRRDGIRKNPVTSVTCTLFRTRIIAVTSSRRRGIHGWDLVSQRQLFGFDPQQPVYEIACVSLGQQLIVLGTGPGPVTGWDAETGRRLFVLPTSAQTRAVAAGVLHSRPVAVTGDDDGLVRLWDINQEAGH